MNNKNLIVEDLKRIQEIMYGKSLISEGIVGVLSRAAMQNAMKVAVRNAMDNMVTKFGRAAFNSLDSMRGGLKNIDNRVMSQMNEEAAQQGFKKSYNQLLPTEKIQIDNWINSPQNKKFLDDSISKNADETIKKNPSLYKDLKIDADAGKKTDIDVTTGKKKKTDTDVTTGKKKKTDKDIDAGKDTKTGKGNKRTRKPKKGRWARFIDNVRARWSKMTWKQKLLWLLGAGVALYLIYEWFNDEVVEFSDCLKKGMNAEDFKKLQEINSPEPVVIRTKTGVPQLDAMGGLVFMVDGTVKTATGQSGTWVGDDTSTTVTIGGQTVSIPCDETPIPPPPPPPPPTPKECTSFPMEKGCKSNKIKDIQRCLGVEPQTGFYGDETEKALIEKDYNVNITQEVYDEIMKNCAGGGQGGDKDKEQGTLGIYGGSDET